MNNVRKRELSCILTHDKKVFWTQQRMPKVIFQPPYGIWEKPKVEWVKVEKDGQTANTWRSENILFIFYYSCAYLKSIAYVSTLIDYPAPR